MIKAELITELEAKGTLKVLLESGLISTHHIFYHEIYYQVMHRISIGMKRMDAYAEFSERYGVCDKTIQRAVSEMRKPVHLSYTVEGNTSLKDCEPVPVSCSKT